MSRLFICEMQSPIKLPKHFWNDCMNENKNETEQSFMHTSFPNKKKTTKEKNCSSSGVDELN